VGWCKNNLLSLSTELITAAAASDNLVLYLTETYVDDIPIGCDKIDDLFSVKEELIILLSKNQFKL